MTLVVDASVAVKWVLDEDGSDAANVLNGQDRLVAPTLICAEIANALWKAVRRRIVRSSDAKVALKAAIGGLNEMASVETLSTRAFELAIELEHPIYDCYYLALAEQEGAPLVTADEKLYRAAKRLKSVQTRML